MALGTPETIDLDATSQPVRFVDEGSDVSSENRELSELVSYVEGRFSRAKQARDEDEERWLTNYRNYRGIYGPDVQFSEKEKSKAFVKITKTKV